jgi:hypothetical protein
MAFQYAEDANLNNLNDLNISRCAFSVRERVLLAHLSDSEIEFYCSLMPADKKLISQLTYSEQNISRQHTPLGQRSPEQRAFIKTLSSLQHKSLASLTHQQRATIANLTEPQIEIASKTSLSDRTILAELTPAENFHFDRLICAERNILFQLDDKDLDSISKINYDLLAFFARMTVETRTTLFRLNDVERTTLAKLTNERAHADILGHLSFEEYTAFSKLSIEQISILRKVLSPLIPIFKSNTLFSNMDRDALENFITSNRSTIIKKLASFIDNHFNSIITNQIGLTTYQRMVLSSTDREPMAIFGLLGNRASALISDLTTKQLSPLRFFTFEQLVNFRKTSHSQRAVIAKLTKEQISFYADLTERDLDILASATKEQRRDLSRTGSSAHGV